MAGHFYNYTLHYTSGYKQEENFLVPIIQTKKVVMNHTKRYHNCLYLLAGLPQCARDLMDYMTENMDDENMFSHNAYTRVRFIEFINSVTNGKVAYGHDSIKKAVKKLTDKGLILPKDRGVYQVNPEYFIKNWDKERLGLIKVIMEFEENEDTGIKIEFYNKQPNGNGKDQSNEFTSEIPKPIIQSNQTERGES